MELPINGISQCVLPGNIKNEVQIQVRKETACNSSRSSQ